MTPVIVLAALFATFPLLLAVHAGRISDRFGVRYPMLVGGMTMSLALAQAARVFQSSHNRRDGPTRRIHISNAAVGTPMSRVS